MGGSDSHPGVATADISNTNPLKKFKLVFLGEQSGNFLRLIFVFILSVDQLVKRR